MSVDKFPFGALADGTEVMAFRISRGAMSAVLLDYGATLQSLVVPGRTGAVDVVLGYESAGEYERREGNTGGTVGRYANRIGGGEFELNGRRYVLARNSGPNHLHGGLRGFDRRMWSAEAGADHVRFSRLSPDGEEGYPGNLHVAVTYTLTERGLRIAYDAVSDADTVISLTNHSYFNLAGGGTALAHELRINAESFTENDENCLPTGRLIPVAGTPFDFRAAKPVGRDIGADDGQLAIGHGYDHNFALSGRDAAELYSPASGVAMNITTDMPGVQLYTANFLERIPGKLGALMEPHGAVCLETQEFPDAVHHADFPSPVLRAGAAYHRETELVFEVR